MRTLQPQEEGTCSSLIGVGKVKLDPVPSRLEAVCPFSHHPAPEGHPTSADTAGSRLGMEWAT